MRTILSSVVLLWAAVTATVLQAAPDFPPLTGRVVDQADLLSTQAERQLTALLEKHEQTTSNQVVVVTLNSLQGYEISDYGYQLGRHWAIGQEGRDNGVLLIVAPNERKVRIEVGYGLEGALTDALSKTIIESELTPRFKKGDMEGGIIKGTRAILAAIEGTYEPQKTSHAGASSDDLFEYFGLSVILSMIFSGTVRQFIGNRFLASGVMGGIAGVIGWVLFTLGVGLFAGIVVFVINLLTGLGGRGGGGYHGGGYRGGRYYSSHSSGGGFSGGFSGGGGSFGGGGASGGW